MMAYWRFLLVVLARREQEDKAAVAAQRKWWRVAVEGAAVRAAWEMGLRGVNVCRWECVCGGERVLMYGYDDRCHSARALMMW
jgi:hypothetical protein